LLLILVGCCAYTIFAQIKIAIGEEWTVILKRVNVQSRDIAATGIKLYKWRMAGLALVHLAVFVGVIFCMNNMRTNFTTSDIAYDKEVKEFVAVGTVDWLPESRYTIVDVDELSCEANFGQIHLDTNGDKRTEYNLRGRYTASATLENWKRFVARAVDGGDERAVFDFCEYVQDELFFNLGQPYVSKGECEGEPLPSSISANAREFFAKKGLALEIDLDINSIEHLLK